MYITYVTEPDCGWKTSVKTIRVGDDRTPDSTRSQRDGSESSKRRNQGVGLSSTSEGFSTGSSDFVEMRKRSDICRSSGTFDTVSCPKKGTRTDGTLPYLWCWNHNNRRARVVDSIGRDSKSPSNSSVSNPTGKGKIRGFYLT